MRRKLLKIDWRRLTPIGAKPLNTDLVNQTFYQAEIPYSSEVDIKRDLLDSIKSDAEYRRAWNLENVYTGICFQIRALREQREWSQRELGKQAHMAQERISILEDPNADTKPTLNTLLRLADAYDVGLDVRFVSYSTVLDRSTKTSFADLEVPSFSNELPDLERRVSADELRREFFSKTYVRLNRQNMADLSLYPEQKTQPHVPTGNVIAFNNISNLHANTDGSDVRIAKVG
jgi:transcriptional regulator with XRE-family HTH domain